MTTEAKLAAENEELRKQLVEATNTLKSIRPSELRYRRVFEAAHDGVLILNADTGHIEDANPFMADLLGYTHDQFVGKHLWEIGLFKDVKHNKATFCELQEKGYIRYEDMPLRCKNGIQRQVEFVSNVYDVGDQKAIQCNIRDITERKLAEAACRENEENFRILVETSPDAVLMADLEGHITLACQRAVEMYGAENAEELLGRNPLEFFVQEDHSKFLGNLQKTLDEGVTRGVEYTFLRKDGSRFSGEVSAAASRDVSGKPTGFVAIVRDITEHKRAQEALKQHQETVAAEAFAREKAVELAETNRRKDEFLAMLAHELRNPLAPIRNGIDVLRILPPNGDQAKILGMMEEQAHNLVRLIDDLLDVSRCGQGKIELRRQQVALTKIITNAIQTAQPLIHANGHVLTLTQAPESLHVHGDPTRLTQVVSNLLNNAARYTPRGGKILLTTERIGDEVAIRVKDNGSGIASGMLPKIFEMFVQADTSLNRKHGGLGIGLTLVKSLVEMHGGTVEATSDGLGKGSEFTVRLPILHARDVVPDEANDLPHERRSFPPHKILIVDDVQPIAFIVATLLRSYGQTVRTAGSGEEALAMIEEEKPELIFSDISMPEMTGHELAQEIRRRPEWNDICLVAVTGYGQESDKKEATDAGFNTYVVKPICKEDLERLLVSLAYLR